ncbi:MAG: tetratricopeptide repeat protein [Longimicrobiales bacterium]|nr:tetratricopeptide repeat protein [Longimicrobiales bacterium]
MDPTAHGQRRWEAAAAAVALLLYLHTVGYGWVFDDQMEVVLNPFIRSWSTLPQILSTTVWTGSGMETYLYRPLAQVSFLLNHAVSGLEPWSYHLVNVLLHAGVSVLVVRLGRALGLPLAAAGLAGIVFALHPVHVEVVAAVHGRKDLLATLFALGFVLAHLRARSSGGWWHWAAPAALVAAILSKETGFVAPALALVVDAARSGGPRAVLRDGHARRLLGVYAVVVGALWMVRVSVAGAAGVPETAFWDNPLVQANPWVRLGTALVVLGRGVGTLVLPLTLSPDYSYEAIPLVRGAGDPRLILTLALAGLAGWLTWRARHARPWMAAAALWYLLALFPGSNLLVTVGTLYGDRLLYLPSVAFALLVGWALHPRTPRVRPLAWALAAAVGLGYGLRTLQYTAAWTDDVSLFRWAVQAVPASTKAHHKLGEEYLRAGRVGEALEALNRAVAIAPDNVWAGTTRRQAVERAAREYRAVLDAPLQAVLPTDPHVLHALGQILRGRGDAAGAQRVLLTALARDPGMALAAEELAVLYLQEGETREAARLLEEALRADPDLVTPWYTLGQVRRALGDGAGARQALERFIAGAGDRYPREVARARALLEGR